MATFTLQEVYDSCYGIIAQWEDSTAYPTSLLLTFIQKAQNDICYGTIQNLSTNERLKKSALNFLEASQFYTTYNFATVTTLAVVWATTLACTNSLNSSGYIWINGNIISYSANDWTTISWIPAIWEYSIQFAHKTWTQVFQLDELPDDYWQVSRIFLTLDSVRTRTELKWIDSRDLTAPVPNSYLHRFFFDWAYANTSWVGREWYYSILRGKFILFLVNQTAGQALSFEYQKKPTQLSATTDLLTIPDDYSLNTIPYLAVSEMMMARWEADEWIKLNNFGFQNIKSMYEFYNSQRIELPFNQRVTNSSEWFLNI